MCCGRECNGYGGARALRYYYYEAMDALRVNAKVRRRRSVLVSITGTDEYTDGCLYCAAVVC